ncbi:MAG: winged helix-turn-helix transcriptional regulator [Acidimicrobiales bacterium]
MRSYGQYCSIAKALDVVGDRWTLLIVRELIQQGPCRFTDLQNGLPGIATNLLTERLRDLEGAGLLWREPAPPPVATTLYHLTDNGRELEPVLTALGRFGVRYMAEPRGDEVFRSHWLSFPATEFLHDSEPTGPPLAIQVRTGDEAVVIEVRGGEVTTRGGSVSSPDLELDGDPAAVLGVLAGKVSIAEARRRGLRVKGDTKVLLRLTAASG